MSASHATPPAAPSPSTRITVQPVGRSVSVWWPTLIPGTAVSVWLAPAAGAGAEVWPCSAAITNTARKAIEAAGRIIRTPRPEGALRYVKSRTYVAGATA